MSTYADFIARKVRAANNNGTVNKPLPTQLFDWQKAIATWAMRKGQAAVFADCGL